MSRTAGTADAVRPIGPRTLKSRRRAGWSAHLLVESAPAVKKKSPLPSRARENGASDNCAALDTVIQISALQDTVVQKAVVQDGASLSSASLSSASEEQLAVRAQTGCAESFEQLVRRCQAPLVQFLVRRTRCRADAEDLAQETFVRAHRALERYQPMWRFRTWLFTIAHRLSLNLRRRQVREEPMIRPDDVRSNEPEVSDSLVAQESRRAVWQVVGELLDEEQVTLLWLYYVEQMSTAELGRVLGRSRGAVKTILFRARKKLLPGLRALVDGNGAAACAAPPVTVAAATWKVSSV